MTRGGFISSFKVRRSSRRLLWHVYVFTNQLMLLILLSCLHVLACEVSTNVQPPLSTQVSIHVQFPYQPPTN
jgi:hypothetical protein